MDLSFNQESSVDKSCLICNLPIEPRTIILCSKCKINIHFNFNAMNEVTAYYKNSPKNLNAHNVKIARLSFN